jgi:hypothetical protein
MGKWLGAFGAAIALLALAVSAVTPALGSSGDERERIRVNSITTEEEFLDLGAEGFSLGDEIVFSTNLRKGGEQVGRLGVVCTFTSVENEEAECVATAWFRGGQIAVQGLIAGEPQSFVLPITGGSGKYEGAEGEVHVRQVSDTEEVLTFRLSD